MADRSCTMSDCDNRVYARSWCEVHYSRWRRTGDPRGREALSAEDRFWGRVVFSDNSGVLTPSEGCCWLWMGAKSKGYGYFVDGGKSQPAYRWIYKRLISDEIDGLDLDHLCRVPACVNPWHLEPVSHQVNCQRGRNACREKSCCPQGHDYSPENTYVTPSGTRQCKICKRAKDSTRGSMRAWRAKRQDAQAS